VSAAVAAVYDRWLYCAGFEACTIKPAVIDRRYRKLPPWVPVTFIMRITVTGQYEGVNELAVMGFAHKVEDERNSPPKLGGVAAPLRRSREATEAAQTGW